MYLLFPRFSSCRAAALCAAALILGALPGWAADPVVSNLKAVQREGTKLVDITYDVAADTPTVQVSLQISGDGGATFAVRALSVAGAVGPGVSTGIGKALTWNAGADWNGQYSPQVRFKVVADDAPVGFATIPAGAFSMGDNLDGLGDAPVRSVTVSAFYMGKTEVTKGEWDEVRTWAVGHGYTDLTAGAGKAANHPVQTVSWWDAIKWCNARSEKEGLAPCYAVGGSPMRVGTTAPTVDWATKGYRLPTEAEWEKAARGGLSGKRFPWGDTISHSQANYWGSDSSTEYTYDLSRGRGLHPSYDVGDYPYTSPVGSFAANAYGLQDVAGNVWEWCWDWYGNYTSGAQSDPRGATSGGYRVCRGGTWDISARGSRVAMRNNFTTYTQGRNNGFRVLKSSDSLALGFAITGDSAVRTRGWILSLAPSASQNGKVSGAGEFVAGTDATLTALSNVGYTLSSWTGAAAGSANPLAVTMDSDKMVGATFARDARDPDGDGLSNYDELVTRSTDPAKADTDGDGLSDGAELGLGRFSVVLGRWTWMQARADAGSRGGALATFVNAEEWALALQSMGESALQNVTGLWIGATDSAVEGAWKWAGGEAFGFANWASGQPDNLNDQDFAAVAGDLGGSLGKWYDYRSTVTLDGYVLEQGYATSPLNPDSDGDGLNDGQERAAATHPGVADSDQDGLSDGLEVLQSLTNPLLADSDGDGIGDLLEDSDGDGLSNEEERGLGTHLGQGDSDGDGISDRAELGRGRFEFVSATLTWPAASAAAAARGGYLATFRDAAELAEAMVQVGPSLPGDLNGFWIGATDRAVEGSWRWVTGEAFGFAKWATGEPNDLNNSDYAAVAGDASGEEGKWYDFRDVTTRSAYLLEKSFVTNPLLADTDGDDLPDGAELTRGTAPVAADSDGDGYVDGVEVALGGDPLNAAQGPAWRAECRASATKSGTVEIRFPSAVGRTYAVEVSSDLKNWQVLQSGLAGNGRVLAREVVIEGQAVRYFRVR